MAVLDVFLVRSLITAGGKLLAKGGGVVIGKMDDLTAPGALRRGERLLDLPNRGSPRANWEQNSSRLREAMRPGNPIRDASIDPATGKYSAIPGFCVRRETYLPVRDGNTILALGRGIRQDVR